MPTTINGVTATLGRDPRNLQRFQVKIQVYSTTKTGLKASKDLDPGEYRNQKELMADVRRAGEQGAEYLGINYFDNLDPAQCGRFAVKAFTEECKLQAALRKSGPLKITRLMNHKNKLKSYERHLLKKLHRLVIKKKQPLTPVEADWIDKTLAEIHGESL